MRGGVSGLSEPFINLLARALGVPTRTQRKKPVKPGSRLLLMGALQAGLGEGRDAAGQPRDYDRLRVWGLGRLGFRV